MGVFSRLRRRSSGASPDEATASAVTADNAEAEAESFGDEASGAAKSPEAADGVEIPKQQSPEEAVDSEAGENARK
ncbi:gliding motility protein [Streptomyces sp. KR80]|uniref:gliding motility protein n=1 Tax=Streptomyces sp. KR80 TaxID=3457426 RepID=UPI003FD4D706